MNILLSKDIFLVSALLKGILFSLFFSPFKSFNFPFFLKVLIGSFLALMSLNYYQSQELSYSSIELFVLTELGVSVFFIFTLNAFFWALESLSKTICHYYEIPGEFFREGGSLVELIVQLFILLLFFVYGAFEQYVGLYVSSQSYIAGLADWNSLAIFTINFCKTLFQLFGQIFIPFFIVLLLIKFIWSLWTGSLNYSALRGFPLLFSVVLLLSMSFLLSDSINIVVQDTLLQVFSGLEDLGAR